MDSICEFKRDDRFDLMRQIPAMFASYATQYLDDVLNAKYGIVKILETKRDESCADEEWSCRDPFVEGRAFTFMVDWTAYDIDVEEALNVVTNVFEVCGFDLTPSKRYPNAIDAVLNYGDKTCTNFILLNSPETSDKVRALIRWAVKDYLKKDHVLCDGCKDDYDDVTLVNTFKELVLKKNRDNNTERLTLGVATLKKLFEP